MPQVSRHGESAPKPPKMQFNLSALVGLVVVCALIFAIVRILNDGALAPDAAFGVLGWFLLAALALIVTGTNWKAAQNYQKYLDEIKRSSNETKAARERIEAMNERIEECGVRCLETPLESKVLLQEILDELRKKS